MKIEDETKKQEKTILCCSCRAEFSADEVQMANACPKCGSKSVPADLRLKHTDMKLEFHGYIPECYNVRDQSFWFWRWDKMDLEQFKNALFSYLLENHFTDEAQA